MTMDSPQALTSARLAALADALHVAAQHPGDADAIHKLRVSTRRFGQCLRVFEAAFEKSAVKKIRRRMKKWMKRCGEARNGDITLALLKQGGFGARSAVAKQVQAIRADAERELEKHLPKADKRDIGEKWGAQVLTDRLEQVPPPDFVTLTEELFAEGAIAASPETSYEDVHQFRLLAKRYRYSVELLGGDAAETVVDGMKTLQDKLGDMNDCVTALDLIEGHARAEQFLQDLLAKRTTAFRRHWKRKFEEGRRQEWISIFCGMAMRNLAEPALRKHPGRSPSVDGRMSAAS